jgi:hypothetical protein
MQAPSSGLIEMGADLLKSVPEFIATDQLKELSSFGDDRAKAIGASGVSPDFQKGYELGLATARTVLSNDISLILAKIDPKTLL